MMILNDGISHGVKITTGKCAPKKIGNLFKKS